MPLVVTPPTSRLIAQWRPPAWQRVAWPVVGVVLVVWSFRPYADEPYAVMWQGVLLGAILLVYGLRPRLRLHEDALYVRGFVLSRVIPIELVTAVNGGYGGLRIYWGTGKLTEAAAIGEQTNIGTQIGSDGRRLPMSELIMRTRDEYLDANGMQPLPDPWQVAGERSQEKNR